jgi:hypothetical protein
MIILSSWGFGNEKVKYLFGAAITIAESGHTHCIGLRTSYSYSLGFIGPVGAEIPKE